MTAVQAAPGGRRPAGGEGREGGDAHRGASDRGGDPGTRGGLELRDRAVAKLVVAAAGEVQDVASPVPRVLRQALGSPDLDGQVKADVSVAGDLVTVRVSLSVRWPAPILEVAEAVRQSVTQRLAELAGLRVSHVDIRVTALPADRRTRRRVQ